MDSAWVYAESLARLLGGEEALCAVMASYFSGEERGGPRAGTSFDPVNGLSVGAWEAAAQRFFAGVSLIGAPGSEARAVREAFNGSADHLVLTRERVIVAQLGADRAVRVWEASATHLVGARRLPRLLQRGRVALDFADGSTLCLMTGMFGAGQARRLVEAVGRLRDAASP